MVVIVEVYFGCDFMWILLTHFFKIITPFRPTDGFVDRMANVFLLAWVSVLLLLLAWYVAICLCQFLPWLTYETKCSLKLLHRFLSTVALKGVFIANYGYRFKWSFITGGFFAGDMPVFTNDEVLYNGQQIGIILARSGRQARQAAGRYVGSCIFFFSRWSAQRVFPSIQ